MHSDSRTSNGLSAQDIRRLGESLHEYVLTLPEPERRTVYQMLLQTMEPLDRFLCLKPTDILDGDEIAILDSLKKTLPRERSPAATDLSLIVKVTRQCTLGCIYCNDRRSDPNATMAFPVAARMIARALDEHKHVRFIWHGGEPTLLPVRFYEQLLLIQAHLRRQEQTVSNSFQTNATSITSDWARFFRENDIQVGVSIDGPQWLHDSHRSYQSGKGSYEDVIRGLSLLRQYGVKFSGLVVVEEDTLRLGAVELLDFLVSQGIRHFGLLPTKPQNEPAVEGFTPTSHYIEPRRVNKFLMELYDAWLDRGDQSIKIRELEALKSQIRGVSAHSCTLSGTCWGHYCSVEPDGSVAACDVFSGDPRYTLGNVMSDSFTDMTGSDTLARLKKEHCDAVSKMKCCPEFSVCNGWCPHERYVSIRHNKQHRNDCCGLRDLIAHIRNRMADEPGMSATQESVEAEKRLGPKAAKSHRILLGPGIDLHVGVHTAFSRLLGDCFQHIRKEAMHCFMMADQRQQSPFRFFHWGELVDFGPGRAVVHSARWPVLNRRAWVTDTDDFVYPVVCGRHFLSPDFRSKFRKRWPTQFQENIRKRVVNMLTAYAHPSCKAILYRSESTANHARLWLDKLDAGQLGEIYLSKIQILYPAQEGCSPDVMEAKWSESGPLTVVFCGRDYESKNGRTALEVFHRLSRQFKADRFVYIGNIPEEELQRRHLGTSGVILHQSLSHKQTLSIFRGAHILFHPSEFEGLGIVFLEAAASGMAVITATGGAMRDVEELFGTGGAMLVDRDRISRSEEVLVFEAHLRQMLGNRGVAKSMAYHNFNLATVGKLSPERGRGVLQRVYEEALDRPAEAPLTLEQLPYKGQTVLRFDSRRLEADGQDYRRELDVTQTRFLL